MRSCEICNERLEAFTAGGPDGLPATWRCAKCGLVQLRFSDDEAAAWRGYWREPGRYHKERVLAGFASFEARLAHDLELARIRMENIVRFLHGGWLLDVGASNGALVRMALEYGFDAVGVEPDPWVVMHARAAGCNRMFCKTFEEYTVAAPSDSFHVIVFNDSFEHLLDPHGALEECLRMLARWSLLVLEMPDADCPNFKRLGASWKHFKPREHAYLYGRRHIETLLRMHRLALIDTIMPYPDRRAYYARKSFTV